MHKIKIRTFLWFWESYEVKKHWFETILGNERIPPRLVMQTSKNDIVVISSILARDWRINGISSTTSEGVRSTNSLDTTTNNDKPLLQPNDDKGRREPFSAATNVGQDRGIGRAESGVGNRQVSSVDSGLGLAHPVSSASSSDDIWDEDSI